jgi:hypothetical protein
VGTETQTYTWDGEGSLMGSTVTVTPPAPAAPTVTTVTYDVDAKGLRIARRVNGTIERQWMYDGQLRIVGEVVCQAQVSYRVYGYVPARHLPVLSWREGELECGHSRNAYPTESMNSVPSNAVWRSVGPRGAPSSTTGGVHMTDAPCIGEVQL